MTSFKDYLKENVEKHIAAPTTVLLRRVAIRQFPGQESVVLYTNEALGLKVTVPIDNFTGKMRPTNVYGMTEEQQLTEAPIHSINTILRTGEEREVAFRNGASARVHPVTAKAIHDLWHKVNSTNKAKLSELINSSPEGLVKVAKFASDLAGAKK